VPEKLVKQVERPKLLPAVAAALQQLPVRLTPPANSRFLNRE
jgi:hypothetical protein